MCLKIMGDFLNPGTSRQLQSVIKKKLKLIVIPHLHMKNCAELPLPVLEGLNLIIKDQELGGLFSDSCPYLVGWIKSVCTEILNKQS